VVCWPFLRSVLQSVRSPLIHSSKEQESNHRQKKFQHPTQVLCVFGVTPVGHPAIPLKRKSPTAQGDLSFLSSKIAAVFPTESNVDWQLATVPRPPPACGCCECHVGRRHETRLLFWVHRCSVDQFDMPPQLERLLLSRETDVRATGHRFYLLPPRRGPRHTPY